MNYVIQFRKYNYKTLIIFRNGEQMKKLDNEVKAIRGFLPKTAKFPTTTLKPLLSMHLRVKINFRIDPENLLIHCNIRI
jgi:deoxyribodipyrimidine photolyase